MRTRRSPVVFVAMAGLIASLLAVSPLALAASATGSSSPAQAPATTSAAAAGGNVASHIASGWLTYQYVPPAVTCPNPAPGAGVQTTYFTKSDCGFGKVTISSTASGSTVTVKFFNEANTQVGADEAATLDTANSDGSAVWAFDIDPSSLPSGDVTVRAYVSPDTDAAGQDTFFVNKLGVDFDAVPQQAPGAAFSVTGVLNKLSTNPAGGAVVKTPTGGTFDLQLITPDHTVKTLVTGVTASAANGTFTAAVPAGAAGTGGVATPAPTYRTVISLVAVNALSADSTNRAANAGQTPVTIQGTATALTFEYSFVSSVGWVKPGQTYPMTVRLTNNTATPVAAGVTVTIPAVDGMTFVAPTATAGNGSAVLNPDGSITWTAGAFNAPAPSGVASETLIIEATAKTTAADPTIVWKNLSTTATMHGSGPDTPVTTHGPKVVPPDESFDTARYGDRPFPVVPVDFSDRSHDATHTGQKVSQVINDPGYAGSTFNLYQEMSYGQLLPEADVPSANIASADWDTATQNKMTDPAPKSTCHGATLKSAAGTPLLPKRIVDGWYQLPGSTDYYGDDSNGSALIGAVTGVGQLQDIDSACGPTGKSVYDAAAIADPEINYNDFDTDKDGVVDFFMMLFVGKGGNGDSQINGTPPYDNIWPHSSDIQNAFVNGRGEKGYVTDDPLISLTGKIQCYVTVTATSVSGKKDCDNQAISPSDPSVIHVRVGPYNVNPETAIDKASVISHEYGHSLGLPDFYSTGSRATYGDWNLMAQDKSQNMDVFSKQELGWIVPQELKDIATTKGTNQFDVNSWADSKIDTGTITWKKPDGTPYTLSQANNNSGIHNGQAYVASLPRRQIIDPATVPSGNHVWWSQSGNDFGCPPNAGHNLDITLPELAKLPSGTDVKITFKTHFDMEWNYDYGFVLTTTDGKSYTSLPSSKGYTTASANPNSNGCQAQYGNGITGTNESYDAGTSTLDGATSTYPDTGKFSDDEYHFATTGQASTLRFTYATDPGLARPGWFIDDLKIEAGGQTIYSTDFESTGSPTDQRVFNGGCKETTAVAARCTHGWQYVDASTGSPADHAYYLEMRDRSGFDYDGHGQNDRDPIGFQGGLLLTYTDESHGYGNFGVDDPPAQSPLDSVPEPGNESPDLNDAAFTAATGRSTYTDASAVGGHTDNYTDPSSPSGNWEFKYDCLTFQVLSMTGNDDGPAQVAPVSNPSELQGNVRFTLGPSCGSYNYGLAAANSGGGGGGGTGGGSGLANTPPTAVPQAKPTTALVNEPVQFDGSSSFDDTTPASSLTYQWDFDGDGTYDATGQTVSHAYATPGVYQAVLKVTDQGGLSSTRALTVTITVCDRGDGYRLVAADGGVFNFGSATPMGSMGGTPLNSPIVGTAATPSCKGYWMVGSDGGLFSFGDAKFFGSTGGMTLNQPIVAMTPTPSGKGYWMVASDGGIFAFGDAAFYGSMGGTRLNKPVVGMAATPSGKGYWLVASDGGIFAFGDAVFYGSTGSTPLNKPIVGMTRTPSGRGYWFVASDGGMFAFGDAPFVGSLGSTPLNKPIVGMAAFPGMGYWLVASDGGVFSFGDAPFKGSTGGIQLNQPIVAMASLG